MKHLKSLFAILVIAAFVLSACGGGAKEETPSAPVATEPPVVTESPTEAPSTSGGTVIIGTPQEPGMMNTLLTSSSIEDAVVSLFGEGLVSVNEKGEYVPVLAKELPTVSEDGLVVTWKLKEGIKWSDGSDFNCDDVKFTMEGALSDLSQVSASGYRDIEELACPDPYTVVATFGEVYAPYLRLFSYTVPDTAGKLEDMESWDINRNPVGTGPFVLSEWVPGDHLTFTKNPYYREPGKPYLESVIIKILPSREVGMQLLGTGEIHALWDLTEANFPELEQLSSQGVSYVSTVTGENELLSLNFGNNDGSAPADPATNPHPILYDLKVRQAIQYAINKQQIVDSLLYGNVKAGSSAVPTGTFACLEPVSEFSVEKANALLDEAGWTLGADGIREKDGVRMSLKIATTTGNQLREQTEQVLAEMLKAAGIELVIENVPSDVLFAGWESDGMRDHGTYDIVMYTTGPSTDPDSHLYSSFHSSEIPTADNEGSGANFARYINSDVDTWLDEAGAITDIAKRKELYCNVVEQVNKDLPRIYLYERLSIMGHRNEFQGLKISPTFVDFAWDSANWTLDQ
ncbi:MAG: peptide ABC transporter substrate-binding protein [Anaerolineales bacterium]|nr:peptide ABC transporter substrate-binding protein [Anaerolineales bacterium]